MKRCVFCDGEYPDEVSVCPLDRQPLDYDLLLHPITASKEILPLGRAFDVSTMAPQIRELHRDRVTALGVRPHPASQRHLVALALRAIVRLPFFHREKTGAADENESADKSTAPNRQRVDRRRIRI